MSELLLEARGLYKDYCRRGLAAPPVKVLEDLDFLLAQGETVAIQGESGVGKTTLLNLLGGLDRPDSGILLFGGEEIPLEPAARARWRRGAVGIIFQFHGLLGEFTAAENVALAGLIRGWRRVDALCRAEDLLGRLGLAERSEHHPDQLSGGEQQRVALARALVTEPALLLADEPTGNLDPRTGGRVLDTLFDLQQELGFSLVVATHSERLARRCHRALRLERGRLVAITTFAGSEGSS